MDDPYVIGAWIVAAVNAVAAVLGLALWLLGRPGPLFWVPARTGQVVAAAYAVFCGAYAVVAEPPPDGLVWVYILTPIAVSYFAEQLRLVAAQTVLERHGFESAEALRASVTSGDVDGDRFATGIAHEVVLREVAVVATAAFVIAFLAWRATITG
ncbi:MAG: hypothetical protein JHD16_12985 [Solirubrobacteraceae bacterium]|nr:hypothetical protein [Solirubrobacteraceae bacterium]